MVVRYWRLLRGLVRPGPGVIAGVLTGAVLALPLITSEQYVLRDWAVNCDGAPAFCVLSRTASSSEDDHCLGTVPLYPAEDGGAGEFVLIPAAVHLVSGVHIGTRQPLTEIVSQSCAPSACTASGRIDRDELRRWKPGAAAQLRYRPGAVAPPVTVSLSLMGIGAARRYVSEAES